MRDECHCIVSNAPTDSPLGLSDADGLVVETKWLLDGHGLGHGYADEYRSKILRDSFLQQQQYLQDFKMEAELPEDYLKVLEYAGIPTYSFNLGIDRYLDCFFGKRLK